MPEKYYAFCSCPMCMDLRQKDGERASPQDEEREARRMGVPLFSERGEPLYPRNGRIQVLTNPSQVDDLYGRGTVMSQAAKDLGWGPSRMFGQMSRENFQRTIAAQIETDMTKIAANYGINGPAARDMFRSVAEVMAFQISELYKAINRLRPIGVPISMVMDEVRSSPDLEVDPDGEIPLARVNYSDLELRSIANQINQGAIDLSEVREWRIPVAFDDKQEAEDGENPGYWLDRMPNRMVNEQLRVRSVHFSDGKTTHVTVDLNSSSFTARVKEPVKLGDMVVVDSDGLLKRAPGIIAQGNPVPDPFARNWSAGYEDGIKAEAIKVPSVIKSIQVVGTINASACDCGAEKCRTTHADWCSSKGGA